MKIKVIKNKKIKIIFTLGGIFSGIGKGVVTASLANLFKNNKQKPLILKLDPYLNIDARYINPVEHGETFVTFDGKETDIDIGHYERFLNEKQSGIQSISLGSIFKYLIETERKNGFLGRTIDFFDVAKEIENKINELIKLKKPDVLLVEIGGNISDYNIQPFLHAIKYFVKSENYNVAVVFLTFVTQFLNNQEFKTRSTQNSIELLRSNSIEPTVLILRSHNKISEKIIQKISRLSTIKIENIFNLIDTDEIFKLVKILSENGVFDKLLNKFGFKKDLDISFWDKYLEEFLELKKSTEPTLNIALINKYGNFKDSYYSLLVALKDSSIKLKTKINIKEVSPQKLEINKDLTVFDDFDGIIIPGGFGSSGVNGKMMAIKHARENNIPLFGICYGMQLSIIEYVRNVLNKKNATSKELSKSEDDLLIIDYVYPNTKKLVLGDYKIDIKDNTKIEKIYKESNWSISNLFERHRHRFGLSNNFLSLFEKDDNFIISGISHDERKLVEIIELKNHPFFLGVQYHPELITKIGNPHPIFFYFLKKVKELKKN